MRALFRGLSTLLAIVILARGFPAGDRIMAVALAVAVASFLVGLVAPGPGLMVVALTCSITGAATAANGTRGILPWPALIALWFGAGAAIRHGIRRSPSSEA